MPVHEHMPGMERLKDEPSLPELSSQLVTMLTTEHYNLQTGRSMTVADANGRCTLFIGAVSGALIAIAFTGQASHRNEENVRYLKRSDALWREIIR
jgi:hypothetical protein